MWAKQMKWCGVLSNYTREKVDLSFKLKHYHNPEKEALSIFFASGVKITSLKKVVSFQSSPFKFDSLWSENGKHFTEL